MSNLSNASETQPILYTAGAAAGRQVAVMPSPAAGADYSSTRDLRSCGSDAEQPDFQGQQLGPYRLGLPVGRGGMGQVYQAHHVHLGKSFAIKFIAAHAQLDDEANRRFVNEFRALGRLKHPNIVAAIDAGFADHVQYFVTELLEGRDLAAWVALRGPCPAGAACEVLRQAALGLAHAHQAGLIHRDIKPGNIFLEQNGTIKLLDFGLVRNHHQPADLTCAGLVLGTLDYLPPEQAEGADRATVRSDLYSLGATLVFLLSGKPPFPSPEFQTPVGKLNAHRQLTVPWLAKNGMDLPAPLRVLLSQLLAKRPADRPNTCDTIVQAMEPVADPNQLAAWITNEPVARSVGNLNLSPRALDRDQVGKSRWARAAIPAAVVLAGILAAGQLAGWTKVFSSSSPLEGLRIHQPPAANGVSENSPGTEARSATPSRESEPMDNRDSDSALTSRPPTQTRDSVLTVEAPTTSARAARLKLGAENSANSTAPKVLSRSQPDRE